VRAGLAFIGGAGGKGAGMERRRGWVSWVLLAVLTTGLVSGCSFGPRALEKTRLRYNEAVKTTTEEQLLLNIVRLRYTDTPSSLAVTTIATQFELQKNISLVPFFTSAGADINRSFAIVLPQAQLQAADRPTVTLTPLDDQEFTRKLFTPLTLEGVLYLAKTTWPIETVFRLYLENLNWVSNAQTASGPTPKDPPTFAEFLRGVKALEALQEREQIAFVVEEREDPQGSTLPANSVTAKDVIEAAKEGFEYHKDDKDGTWTLIKKKQQPMLKIHPAAVGSPEMRTVTEAFHLKPGLSKYDVEVDKLDPFPVNYPPEGVRVLDLETRSLLQVLFFVAKGVEVPPEHIHAGVVAVTVDAGGQVFDWQQVTQGLFRVCWAKGHKPPPDAHVAIKYLGYWFYIDKKDQDTMSTFSLLMEVARLESTGKTGLGPTLTLPIGGR
jgi:hypothetical protein